MTRKVVEMMAGGAMPGPSMPTPMNWAVPA